MRYSLAQLAAYLILTDTARIDNAIRTGLIMGLDSTEIARTVIGSAGVNGIDGCTEVTRREMVGIARRAIKAGRAK